ncbi:glycosyltransferase family 4 protein [Blastopirellula retiformator]|nr:glycosyltransferase family 4 protein [Blastopirellula retiformator]
MSSVSRNPSPRVLYVNASAGLGGAERVLLGLLKACGSAFPDAEITLILFEDGPLRELAEPLVGEVIIVPLPERWAQLGDGGRSGSSWMSRVSFWTRQFSSGTFSLWKWGRDFRRRVAKLRPEILHSNGIKAHLLTSLARPRGCSLVWHLHDFVGERRLAKRLLQVAAKRLTLGLAISEAVKADFEQSIGKQRVEVLFNTVDTERFVPQGGDEVRTRLVELSGAEGPADDSVVFVGLIATYANWKGHFLFLDAIAQCQHRAPEQNACYFIIGGPIYRTENSQVTREELHQHAAALGIQDKVNFVPFQDAMPDVYAGLDVVVHASIRPEPFGLAIVEGMACGKGVISTALGGAAEIFEDGVEGIALSSCDVNALAAALEKVVGDSKLRADLGKNARGAVVERFDQRQLPVRLLATYTRLLVAGDLSSSELDYCSATQGE